MTDILIAGAGIVGAACAFELSRAGFRVTICEPGAVAGGATGAAMGHLAIMDASDAQFALTRFSQGLWRELVPELPPETEYLPCGSIWIAADELEMEIVRRKHGYCAARGVPTEVIDGRRLSEVEPNLRPGMAGGLVMPSDAVCDPPAAARFMVDRVVAAGGTLLQGRRVIKVADGSVLLDNGSTISCSAVVVANGTAAVELIPGLPLSPRKGHLALTDPCPGFVRHQLIELAYLKSAHSIAADSVAFNVQPRKSGQVLIGSSRQYGVTDAEVEEEVIDAIFRRASEYLPGIGGLNVVRAWTGFRAATPDHLPLIGRAAGFQNVLLATGHEGLGISTSLATGRLIADEILRRESEIPREPYSPSRL